MTADVTMELIRRAQQGDEQAKTRLIEENTPLLKSIIRRYVGKGVEYDDLFQISSVGLLKAINNFSLEYNVKFSTYAVLWCWEK
ncbi:MAG: sigma factor [Christensenellales bacterium]